MFLRVLRWAGAAQAARPLTLSPERDTTASRLPEGQRYDSTPELLAALGLAHVEEEPGT